MNNVLDKETRGILKEYLEIKGYNVMGTNEIELINMYEDDKRNEIEAGRGRNRLMTTKNKTESLSDKIFDEKNRPISLGLLAVEDVRKAVKKLKEELIERQTELVQEVEGINYWFDDNKMCKIIDEIFGEKLI